MGRGVKGGGDVHGVAAVDDTARERGPEDTAKGGDEDDEEECREVAGGELKREVAVGMCVAAARWRQE